MIATMGHRARICRAGILGSLTATAAVLVAGFVLAVPAGARTCTKNIAPPGHAGSAQYYETVPTSCGNASPPSAGGSGSGSGSGAGITHLGHGRAGLHALTHLGTNGQAAASLAAATAPPVSGSPGRGGGVNSRSSGSGSGSGNPGATGSLGVGKSNGASGLPWTGSASGALGSALTGSGGGLGVVLPILMGLGLIAALGAGVLRARRSGGPSV